MRLSRLALSLLATVLVACGVRDVSDPALDAAAVERGREIYGRWCASCHGAGGEGAPNWQRRLPDGSFPSPPHDSTGHTWHHADGLIHRIVALGGAGVYGGADPASFPSGMPAFGDSLSSRDIRDVITFMKTWWTERQRTFQSEVSRSDPFPVDPSD